MRLIPIILLAVSLASAQTNAPEKVQIAEANFAGLPDAPVPVVNTGNLGGEPSLTVAENAVAEGGSSSSLTSLAAGATATPLLIRPVLKKQPPVISSRQKMVWYSLAFAEHGAALLDAVSTRDVLRQGGRELDPVVRPFAHSPALYPALQVVPFGLDYLSLKMMRSENPIVRHIWWVPQSLSAATSIAAGTSNLAARRW